MKKVNRFLCLAVVLIIFCSLCLPAFAVNEPEITADAAILLDSSTGAVLYEKDADARMYPASVTKVMTTLIAVEAINSGKVTLQDEVTAYSDLYFDVTGDASNQNIQPGEVLTLEQLLYCAMVASANESCNVIAEYIGGSIESYIDMMNSRAEELGCTGTHFANTHGLQNEKHYTTARDLSIITQKALSYPLFVQLCTTLSYEIPATNKSDSRALYTTNNLTSQYRTSKYYYEYAKGVKTGYTGAAGYCLISTAEKDDMKLTGVVLGCEAQMQQDGSYLSMSFVDMKSMFEWGFSNFSYRDIVTGSELICEIPVELGDGADSVILRTSDSVTTLLSNDFDIGEIEREVELYSESATAPVKAGEVFGIMRLSYDGTELGSVKLVAMRSVDRSSVEYLKSRLHDFAAQKWVKVCVIAVAVIIIAYIIIVICYNSKRRRRRRARQLEIEKVMSGRRK